MGDKMEWKRLQAIMLLTAGIIETNFWYGFEFGVLLLYVYLYII